MEKSGSVESPIDLMFWKIFESYFYVCYGHVTGNDNDAGFLLRDKWE